MRSSEIGRRAARIRRAAWTLVIAVGVLLASAGIAAAASPEPTAGIGDPRSSGAGPGLVGDPLGAVAIVAAIGIVALAVTLAYVRATAGRRGPSGSHRGQGPTTGR
ncbi:MAG: hypothetical protein WCK58_13635 [Chloroflexota bacterium]